MSKDFGIQGLGLGRWLWSLKAMSGWRIPSTPLHRGAFAAALTLTVTLPRPAQALEGEWTGGASLGAAASSRVELSPGLAVRGAYGISSALDLQLEAFGSLLRGMPDEPFLIQVYPSLVYKFDVVRWVPYVAVSAGGFLLGAEPAKLGPSVGGGAGVEYLLDRSFSLGLGYQAHWLVGEDAAVPLHRLGVSATWRSGW